MTTSHHDIVAAADPVADALDLTPEQRDRLCVAVARNARYTRPSTRGRNYADAPARLRAGIPRWVWAYDLTREERLSHVARHFGEQIAAEVPA